MSVFFFCYLVIYNFNTLSVFTIRYKQYIPRISENAKHDNKKIMSSFKI